MRIRTITAAMAALALTTAASAQQNPTTTGAAGGSQPGTQSGMPAGAPTATSTNAMSAQPASPAGSQATTTMGAGAASASAPSASQMGQQAAVTFTDDKSFVQRQLSEQQVEADLFKLAQQKGQTDSVKDLAKDALNDHQKSQKKLQDIASEMNVDKNQAQGQSSSRMRQQVTQLQGVSGEQFDRQFLPLVITTHQRALQEYQAASNQAKEADLKEFARDEVKMIQKHLDNARRAFQEVTGQAWTPTGGQRFMPAAQYDIHTQPGPGSSSHDISGATGAAGTATSPGSGSLTINPDSSDQTNTGASSSASRGATAPGTSAATTTGQAD